MSFLVEKAIHLKTNEIPDILADLGNIIKQCDHSRKEKEIRGKKKKSDKVGQSETNLVIVRQNWVT